MRRLGGMRSCLFVADDGGTRSRVENPPCGYPSGLPWGYFQLDIDEYEEEVYCTTRMSLSILGWHGVVNGKRKPPLGLMLSEGTARDGSSVENGSVCLLVGVGSEATTW